VDVQIHVFLTSTQFEGEQSTSHTYNFKPEERAIGTYFIGGWVDHRAGLDNVEK
jgi:hypothetical protein